MRPERLYLHDIVEAVATEEAPLLRVQVAEVLARDFPDDTP